MFELNKKYLAAGLIGSTLLLSNLFSQEITINEKILDNSKLTDDNKHLKIPVHNEDKPKNRDIFISEDNMKKIKKLKELNYLSNRLSNIITCIPKSNVRKHDIILIKSIRLLIDNINNKMNNKDLDTTIKLFIDSNKLEKSISYNNIISGEILNYLASI